LHRLGSKYNHIELLLLVELFINGEELGLSGVIPINTNNTNNANYFFLILLHCARLYQIVVACRLIFQPAGQNNITITNIIVSVHFSPTSSLDL
jgi:hypothetical protein